MIDAPPWSHVLRLSQVQRAPQTIDLAADEAARTRIARWLDLPSIGRLEGRVELKPWLDGAELKGRWRAELEQTCGVTAEPLAASPSGSFVLRVLPADSPHAPTAESDVAVDPEADDPPDVLEGEDIDVAAYLVEQLALELDPFPRAPGAEFTPPEEVAEPSPFAKLAALKREP